MKKITITLVTGKIAVESDDDYPTKIEQE